jgi:hypothetical protein
MVDGGEPAAILQGQRAAGDALAGRPLPGHVRVLLMPALLDAAHSAVFGHQAQQRRHCRDNRKRADDQAVLAVPGGECDETPENPDDAHQAQQISRPTSWVDQRLARVQPRGSSMVDRVV